MRRAVVDASVAVKWVVGEPHTDVALHAYETRSLTAPALIHAEIASALTKKAAAGELDPDEASRKMAELVSAGIDTVPDDLLAVEAVCLATRLGHPVYDCFYLALAVADDTSVITADRALLRTARDGGLAEHVTWIEDLAG